MNSVKELNPYTKSSFFFYLKDKKSNYSVAANSKVFCLGF